MRMRLNNDRLGNNRVLDSSLPHVTNVQLASSCSEPCDSMRPQQHLPSLGDSELLAHSP
jgi:hypothetical protein